MLLVWLLFSLFYLAWGQDGPRYFHTPMHELQQQALYLRTTAHDEVTVAFTEKGSDLREGDYLTHADGVRILNGGLAAFLKSGEKEAIVPIVEETDQKHDGSKFIGFVMVQIVQPRKLSTRRGEIVFDLEEGGPAPTMNLGSIVIGAGGAKTTSDPSYQPPPHGGGACITGKDCYFFNGTCVNSQCSCLGPFSGTYCQLNRPDMAAAALMKKRQANIAGKQQQQKDQTAQKIRAVDKGAGQQQQQQSRQSSQSSQSQSQSSLAQDNSRFSFNHQPPERILQEQLPPADNDRTSSSIQTDNADSSSQQTSTGGDEQPKKKKKKKMVPKPHPDAPSDQQQQRQQQSKQAPVPVTVLGDDVDNLKLAVSPDVLYGERGLYPEPNPAGRLPNVLLNERHKLRIERTRFLYAVRFRSGPLGLVFDNKVPNSTVVERVIKGQQAEQSDIKEGDVLVAIEAYNVTASPAKTAQRILSMLPWPLVLVFETRYAGSDPKTQQQQVRQRSYNLTVLYPPTLVGEYAVKLAEWTPLVPIDTSGRPSCTVYRLRGVAADGGFGCNVAPDRIYAFSEAEQRIIDQQGFVKDRADEEHSRFLALLMQQSLLKKEPIVMQPGALMKRGVCTFVEKAKGVVQHGGALGLVVNTEPELPDLPAGKEKTGDCTAPFGGMRFDEANFLQLAASQHHHNDRANEDVFAVLSSADKQAPGVQATDAACDRVIQLAEDIMDRWPHSIPALTASEVLKIKPPDQSKVRGLTEEGGRVAVSGANGWSFFDFHLAMFGPQELPLHAMKLVMAQPAFGCDPNAYTVRITNATVAILRGGGCSFGIKVINAQKLGAKAVMILNTDDQKTMRLMALPDEVPLIKIPCIMVSRRLQFYVEAQLQRYFPAEHLLISMQPTGVFGEYESRNTLQLPVRLDQQPQQQQPRR